MLHSCLTSKQIINVLCPVVYNRLFLAAIHNNCNAGRPQHTTKSGAACYRVTYPRYKKGDAVAKPVREIRYGKLIYFLYLQQLLSDRSEIFACKTSLFDITCVIVTSANTKK